MSAHDARRAREIATGHADMGLVLRDRYGAMVFARVYEQQPQDERTHFIQRCSVDWNVTEQMLWRSLRRGRAQWQAERAVSDSTKPFDND